MKKIVFLTLLVAIADSQILQASEQYIANEQPSLFQRIKGWFEQKREAARDSYWWRVWNSKALEIEREKRRRVRRAMLQQIKQPIGSAAERMSQPSQEAQESIDRLEGSGKVQRYEIVPGSPADRMRQWWNKTR